MKTIDEIIDNLPCGSQAGYIPIPYVRKAMEEYAKELLHLIGEKLPEAFAIEDEDALTFIGMVENINWETNSTIT